MVDYGELENILRDHQTELHDALGDLARCDSYGDAIPYQKKVWDLLEVTKEKFPRLFPIYQEMYVDVMTYKTLAWEVLSDGLRVVLHPNIVSRKEGVPDVPADCPICFVPTAFRYVGDEIKEDGNGTTHLYTCNSCEKTFNVGTLMKFKLTKQDLEQ